MKRITALFILVAMICTAMVISTSAAIDATTLPKPTDITDQMKYVTAYEMYAGKLPIVRDDAIFMAGNEYDAAVIGKAPGSGARQIQFTDWAEKGFEYYFEDQFNLGDGDFYYDTAVWANCADDVDDRGQMLYHFKVEEAGTYELVFVGAAQIKADAVDNDAKDRGFTYSVDGGELKQVNISDTKGIFRDYSYIYSGAELEAGTLPVTNGENSQYYQVCYYYGFTVDLTAGDHTLEYYHLFYSGDAPHSKATENGNTSRLNYMGAYVQKYLTDAELANYKYPEIATTQETTTLAPVVTTEKPKDTEAPTAAVTTKAPTPGATEAPDVTTKAPAEPAKKSGCGSVIGLGILAAIIPAAIIIKKKKN